MNHFLSLELRDSVDLSFVLHPRTTSPIMTFWISFAENSRTQMVMGPSSRTFLRLKQCASLRATFILIVVVGSKNATLELRICAFEFLTISVSYDVRTTSWFLQRTLLSAMNSTTPLAFVKCNTVHLPPIMIPFYISAKDHPTTFRTPMLQLLPWCSHFGSCRVSLSWHFYLAMAR